MIDVAIGLGGFLAGGWAGVVLARRRRTPRKAAEPAVEPVLAPVQTPRHAEEGTGSTQAGPLASPHLLSLVGTALREPLRLLRRAGPDPMEAVARLEHVVWQVRMLVSHPRPMQSRPVSPVALLQEAAEQVEALRLGKVAASWTLLNRQPVHVDPERARAALCELLAACSRAVGEGGRLAVRVLQGSGPRYPVVVEVEIGSRGAEVDPLSYLVSRHLLETQGARVAADGGITRIQLRSTPPPDLPDPEDEIE